MAHARFAACSRFTKNGDAEFAGGLEVGRSAAAVEQGPLDRDFPSRFCGLTKGGQAVRQTSDKLQTLAMVARQPSAAFILSKYPLHP